MTSLFSILSKEGPGHRCTSAFLKKFWRPLCRKGARNKSTEPTAAPGLEGMEGASSPLLFPSIAQPCRLFLCSLECPLLPLSRSFPTLDLFFSPAMPLQLGDPGSPPSPPTRWVRARAGSTVSLPPANALGDKSCRLGFQPSSNAVIAGVCYCAVTSVSPAQTVGSWRTSRWNPWSQAPNLAPSGGSTRIGGMISEIK